MGRDGRWINEIELTATQNVLSGVSRPAYQRCNKTQVGSLRDIVNPPTATPYGAWTAAG